MRLLVIGATGKLGQAVVRQAAARSHGVTALARDPDRVPPRDSLRVVRGDVLVPESLDAALAGQDAVVCALGTPSPRRPSTLLTDGTQNLVAAMARQGVRRLVCVTLLGVADSARSASPAYRRLILPMLSPMLPDKRGQEAAVRGSDLDWVIVRPPRFVGGPATGSPRIIADGEPGRVGRVVRAQLAGVLLDLAADGRVLRRTFVVGS